MKLFKILGLVEVSPWDRKLNLSTLILIAIALFFSIYFYSILPDKIPVHFDLQGNVNRYGSKSSIFLLCAITAVLGIGLIVLSNFPETFNYSVKITETNRDVQYKLASSMIRQLNTFTTFCLTIMVIYICLLSSEIIKSSSYMMIIAFILMGGIIYIIVNYISKSGKHK